VENSAQDIKELLEPLKTTLSCLEGTISFVIGFVLNFSLSEPLFNLEQTKQLAQIGEY
jgi:hypothetical protein